MIQVLLLILKIIGITLLSVLGIILLVLAVVLFVPVFYRVRIIHNPKATKVKAKVSFLFPLLLVTVEYCKKLIYKLRVFGFSVIDSEKPKKEKIPKEKKTKRIKKKDKKQNSLQPVENEDDEEDFFVPLESPSETPKVEEQQGSEPEGGPKEEPEPAEMQSSKEKKQGLFKKIRSKIQKIRETIGNIVKKVRKLLHQKEEIQRILAKQETKDAISFVWEKLKRILKHVFPRKIKGYVMYGADNPATTGQVLGALSVIYARTGMLLDIQPNFTEKQLECDVELKGRIQVFTLLVIAVKVFFNQKLRQLVTDFKGLKEIE
ncbi:MAG: hypothetical protein J6K15_08030 [Lachnospiraceae bacterium]|nr:hypothetical protein [Lachnospiraceae bacterium]